MQISWTWLTTPWLPAAAAWTTRCRPSDVCARQSTSSGPRSRRGWRPQRAPSSGRTPAVGEPASGTDCLPLGVQPVRSRLADIPGIGGARVGGLPAASADTCSVGFWGAVEGARRWQGQRSRRQAETGAVRAVGGFPHFWGSLLIPEETPGCNLTFGVGPYRHLLAPRTPVGQGSSEHRPNDDPQIDRNVRLEAQRKLSLTLNRGNRDQLLDTPGVFACPDITPLTSSRYA